MPEIPVLEIPRIALYRPLEEESRLVLRCFPREHYSVRVVEGIEQILSLIEDESAPFDAIIIPPKTRDGDGGIHFISQVRSIPELTSTPICALCEDQKPHLMQVLLNAGAEILMAPPFDADTILTQIRAIARLRSAIQQQHDYSEELRGLRTSAMKALNCSREGMLLFNTSHQLAFLNDASARLLGISSDTPAERIAVLGDQFLPLITAHEASNSAADSSLELPISITEFSAQRALGEQIRLMIRVVSLRGDNGEPFGSTVALTDLSEVHVLAARIKQSQRTRSLCLLAAAGCIQLARGGDPVRASSATDLFEKIVLRDALQCSLSNVTTVFLETLDLMTPPGVQFRVNFNQPVSVALRPADLFQVIGHLALEGIDFCGERGEIEISANILPAVASVRLSLTAKTERLASAESTDYISSLLRGATTSPLSGDAPLAYGVAAARQVLAKYEGTPVSVDYPDEKTLRMRVMLPTLAQSR